MEGSAFISEADPPLARQPHFTLPAAYGAVLANEEDSNGYKQTWRATANGFEGLAEAHCDIPFCLDELGLIRGDHVSQVAYQLSGGNGTTRALKAGAQRRASNGGC